VAVDYGETRHRKNLLEVRIALEGTPAVDMALRGTAADIAKHRSILSQLKASIKDNHNFAALDLEFHITIARAPGNSLLFDLVSMIRGQLVGGLSQVLLLPNAIPLSFKEHTAIFKAIEQRDADASREARHAHLDAALSRYRTALGKRITNAVQTSSPAKGRARKLVR
jgi:GntR family transcriptional regulator, transcriptional repressor for pyruvate dehydrogenase complex